MDELTGVPDWGRLTWPGATERLTLRPATLKDADSTFGYRSLVRTTCSPTSGAPAS